MIAGRPSATALLVALSVWRAGARHGLPECAIRIAGEALLRAGGVWPWLRACARCAPGRWLLTAVEAVLLPGLAAHHCRRKRWLWEALQANAQACHLIWLGVGFDGLARALRARDPSLRVTELDHPDTLALRQSLPALQAEPDVPLQPLQLPGEAAALVRLCAGAPSIVIAEGLLMYLPPRSLLRLLRALARLPAPPALWISALAPAHEAGRGFAQPHALTRRWLRARGEPFRWRLAPERLQALLRRHGFLTEALWTGDGYGEYLLCAAPAMRADRLATAPATAAARRLPPASGRGSAGAAAALPGPARSPAEAPPPAPAPALRHTGSRTARS
jgi:O-methyltransferase involved in polyketide biosynthesis